MNPGDRRSRGRGGGWVRKERWGRGSLSEGWREGGRLGREIRNCIVCEGRKERGKLENI